MEVSEKDLQRDGRNITLLQESLQASTSLCHEMLKHLENFENRVVAREATIMPLSRSLGVISRVNKNVKGTLDVVRMLSEANEVAKREEFLISAGPTMENLEGYLASVERIRSGLATLQAAKLSFCRVTTRRLESAAALAMDSLLQKYKEWLAEVSLNEPTLGSEDKDIILSEGLQTSLANIASFIVEAHSTLETRKDLLGGYSEVRSASLLQSLQPVLLQVENFWVQPKTQTGPPGSHPLIALVERFFMLARLETRLAVKVLPSPLTGEAVRRALKGTTEMIQQCVSTLGDRLCRALGKHEFYEQIAILDAVESCNDLYVEHSAATSPIRDVSLMLMPAIKTLTSAAVDLLKALMDDFQNVHRTTSPPPANATVYGPTSSLMNCLKRIMVFERIAEALLSKWAQPDWNGLLGLVPAEPSIFAMALYYQDILKGLEGLLERQSRMYRRPMVSALFQLNNYNYIVKTFRSCSMAELLTLESQKKYQCIVDSLLTDYLLGWQALGALLDETVEGRAGGMTPKERLKTFSADLDETVQGQANCAVPDLQLRGILLSRIRDLLLPTFVAFYNRHQSLFVASHTRGRLDPDALDGALNKLFQA